jgi:hypothetical protein
MLTGAATATTGATTGYTGATGLPPALLLLVATTGATG